MKIFKYTKDNKLYTISKLSFDNNFVFANPYFPNKYGKTLRVDNISIMESDFLEVGER